MWLLTTLFNLIFIIILPGERSYKLFILALSCGVLAFSYNEGVDYFNYINFVETENSFATQKEIFFRLVNFIVAESDLFNGQLFYIIVAVFSFFILLKIISVLDLPYYETFLFLSIFIMGYFHYSFITTRQFLASLLLLWAFLDTSKKVFPFLLICAGGIVFHKSLFFFLPFFVLIRLPPLLFTISAFSYVIIFYFLLRVLVLNVFPGYSYYLSEQFSGSSVSFLNIAAGGFIAFSLLMFKSVMKEKFDISYKFAVIHFSVIMISSLVPAITRLQNSTKLLLLVSLFYVLMAMISCFKKREKPIIIFAFVILLFPFFAYSDYVRSVKMEQSYSYVGYNFCFWDDHCPIELFK